MFFHFDALDNENKKLWNPKQTKQNTEDHYPCFHSSITDERKDTNWFSRFVRHRFVFQRGFACSFNMTRKINFELAFNNSKRYIKFKSMLHLCRLMVKEKKIQVGDQLFCCCHWYNFVWDVAKCVWRNENLY